MQRRAVSERNWTANVAILSTPSAMTRYFRCGATTMSSVGWQRLRLASAGVLAFRLRAASRQPLGAINSGSPIREAPPRIDLRL